MPFGISIAQEVFQRTLHEVISHLPGVFVIANDILVAGERKTYQQAVHDHDQKLEALPDR